MGLGILLAGALVIMFISLIFLSKGSSAIGSFSGYSKDPKLALAYKYSTWGASVGWSIIILIAILLVLALIFGPEIFMLWGGVLVGGLLLISIAIAIAVGVLASMSAYNIQYSKSYDDKVIYGAYLDLIISAVVSLAAIGLMSISVIYSHYKRYRKQKELDEAEKLLAEVRTKKYIENLEKND